MSENYPFPVEMPFSKEILSQNYWRCSNTLPEDATNHFQIVIPRNWRPVDIAPEPLTPENPLASIALFRSVDEPRGEIEIQLTLLSREVAPGEWLEVYLESLEQKIIHRRDHKTPGGTVSDFLTKAEMPDGEVIFRWLAIKDLNRLFVLQARTLEQNYYDFANAFFIATASFALINPGDWELAERLQTFSRAEPADFLIYIPESWTITQNDSSNENALVLDIKNTIEYTTVGFLTFTVVKYSEETSPQNLADNYVADLRKNGVSVPELLLTSIESHDGFETCWESNAEGTKTELEIETKIFVGNNQDGWFLCGLFGPSRKANPQIWLINKRAFEILIDRIITNPKEKSSADSNSAA